MDLETSKAASLMGRKGGKKSAERLTPEQRKKRAQNAVKARWDKAKQSD